MFLIEESLSSNKTMERERLTNRLRGGKIVSGFHKKELLLPQQPSLALVFEIKGNENE